MAPHDSTKQAKRAPDGKVPPRHTRSAKDRSRKATPAAGHAVRPVDGPAGLRGRAEELALQADLAAMGVRDELRTQVEAAENAWLAARSRLEAAVGDADAALGSLKAALRHVLADLSGAVDAADSAVRRRR